MSSNLYNVEWYTNSVLTQNENYVVTNDKFILNYIPDSQYGVQITYAATPLSENRFNQAITTNSQFYVNYNTGEVTLSDTLDGVTVTVNQYYAKGLIKTIGNRVVLDDNTSVQDFVDLIQSGSGIDSSSVTNSSTVVGTKVTDALDTLKTNADAHLASLTAHAASAISNDSSVTGSKVSTALNTLKSSIDTLVVGASNATIGVYSVNVAGTDTLTATIGGIAAYFGGFKIRANIANANTGSVTLNVNSLGAKTLKKKNIAGTKNNLSASDLSAGQVIDLEYDGTDFVWLSGGILSTIKSDANNVVGLGTLNLKNWTTGVVLHIGSVSSLMSTGSNAEFYITNNAYYNSTWKFISNNKASLYRQYDGSHLFQVSSTGVADNDITWTTAMVIDNTGMAQHYTGAAFRADGGIGNNDRAKINATYTGGGSGYGGSLVFSTRNSGNVYAEQLRITDKGTISVGNSSPASWASDSYAVIQLGGNAGIFALRSVGTAREIDICQNVYFDGAYKYISTDYASLYYQYQGKHIFNVAASGTAGNVISWTTAMTIDNAGNIGVGTTTIDQKLTVLGGIQSTHRNSGTSATPIEEVGYIYKDASGTSIAGLYFYNAFTSAASTQLSLKVTNAGTVLEPFRINSAGLVKLNQIAGQAEAATLSFAEKDTTPAIPSSGAEAKIYMKSDKLVVTYNLGGTQKYFTLDLTATSNQSWVYGTVAP
jgi:hypothetical protein